MKKVLLTAAIISFYAFSSTSWAGKKPTQGVDIDENDLASHLTYDSAFIEKNTGNPNTSYLTSNFANNLPVMNHEKSDEGCYIACNSLVPGVYSVDQYGVHGLIRVAGKYPVDTFSDVMSERTCQPVIEEDVLISESAALRKLCNSHFDSCQDACWAGGDTGGFFLRMGVPAL